MATVKVSSQIAAPVERVFQMFTDIEHGAEHVSGIKKIETLTTGPFSLGTRWQETRDAAGAPRRRRDGSHGLRAEPHLHRHPPQGRDPHRCDVHLRTAGRRDQREHRVRARCHGLPPGLLSPLEWALSGKVRDVLSRDLADLKAAVEKVAH